jgi:hypothetical protein
MLAHPHQPDPQVIADCFERLFSHVTIDGQIEIAYTLPDSNAPKQARMFKVEDYAEAADFAAQINATPGQNVYFGPAIRRPNQPHSRGGDADVVALYTLFADFDDDGASAAATAKMKELGIEAPITVVTGRHPHLRSHKYLPLVEPIRDHALMRNALAHIADLLDGDPACKNQGRLMRIPGSVAWPKKAGRQTEMTELHMPHGRRQQFNLGEITRHQASPQMPLAAPRNDHTGVSHLPSSNLHISTLDAKNADNISNMLRGNAWHNEMITAVGRMVAAGKTDAQIHDDLITTTLPGYTEAETKAEVQEAIDGARRKGYAPKPTIINAVPAVIGEQQEKPFSILDFCAENFTGEPEPIEWLFDEVVPLGIPMMVAAMGDTGKSYMALHACCRVAYGPQKMMEREEVFGGVTAKSGRAVFITAEDSRATLHRRINELDQRGQRFNKPHSLFVVSMADSGGVRPFITETRMGNAPYQLTQDYLDMREDLLTIPDLRLVVIDPLQAFIHADINADPAAAQFMWSTMNELATATGATICLLHHMRKTSGEIRTLAEAREAIRGSTGLVDGNRLTYALWPAPDKDARAIAYGMGLPPSPNLVVWGGVVKANDASKRDIRCYLREPYGLLKDQTDVCRSLMLPDAVDIDAVIATIIQRAEDGHPFTKTGVAGVYERISEFPEHIHNVGRDRLQGAVQEALNDGHIVKCAHDKEKTPKWLDGPHGPFARGLGAFADGTPKIERKRE